jgi:hypothetical protein
MNRPPAPAELNKGWVVCGAMAACPGKPHTDRPNWFRFRFRYVLHPFGGQVQPLDVALSNSVQHSHAIAVPGCSSGLAGKLCTNEAKGAAKCSAVNRVRMSVPTWSAPNRAGYRDNRRQVLERCVLALVLNLNPLYWPLTDVKSTNAAYTAV